MVPPEPPRQKQFDELLHSFPFLNACIIQDDFLLFLSEKKNLKNVGRFSFRTTIQCIPGRNMRAGVDLAGAGRRAPALGAVEQRGPGDLNLSCMHRCLMTTVINK